MGKEGVVFMEYPKYLIRQEDIVSRKVAEFIISIYK